MKLKERQRHMNKRLWAAGELLKRYLFNNEQNIAEYEDEDGKRYYNAKIEWSKEKQKEMLKECIEIIKKVHTPIGSKRAARMIIEIIVGKYRASDMLEGVAVVEGRNDSLVLKWRKAVLKRDGCCVECGDKNNLHAHHVSHWADDPVNRINVDNGITLCKECHAKEHEDIAHLILS